MPDRNIRRKLLVAVCALVAVASAAAAQSPPTLSLDGGLLPRRIVLGTALREPGDTLLARGAPPGARVTGVAPGSSAAALGLRPNDVVVRLGADSIGSVPAMLAAVRAQRAGRRIAVSFWRDGAIIDTAFIGVERPRESSREFTIDYTSVAAQGGRRRVVVTRPPDGAHHPAVLLVGGIGCYSMEQATGPNSYRDFVYHLTRRGFVTIRVEKVGMGDSEGDSCLPTDFDTELDGYRQALRAARHSAWVDPARIILFGHSIGGIEAPLLAGEPDDAPPVRGVIALSTTGISWYEYELANLRRQLVLGGTAPDSVEQQMKDKIGCMYRFLIRREPKAALVAESPECAAHVDYPASDAYMQQVAAHDPASNWAGVEGPVLLLHGGSDFVTSGAEHVELAAMLRRMRPGRAVTEAEVPELDHFLAREASERASMNDPVPPLSRPYFGTTLEPLVDRWLGEVVSATPIAGAARRPPA
jgi:uncharacterized protein